MAGYSGVIKRICGLDTAFEGLTDGMTVLIGGFGGAGSPIELIHALIDHGARDLVAINNNAGNGDVGLAALIRERRVRKLICSFPRSTDPHAFVDAYKAGEIELEVTPQGTLAERIRAAGSGVPAFYTRAGIGTPLEKGRETREFNGRRYLLETALDADFALVKADLADAAGNLTYRASARNFGPLMCAAARCTVVQAREIVEPGAIDPATVVTPGIFVDRLVHVPSPVQEEVLKGVRYP